MVSSGPKVNPENRMINGNVRDRCGDKVIIKGVINPAKNDRRIVIQVGDHPLSDFCKVFSFETFNEIIEFYIRKRTKNTSVNFSTNRVPLTFIKNPPPIWEVFINDFYKNLLIILNVFVLKNSLKTIEEV